MLQSYGSCLAVIIGLHCNSVYAMLSFAVLVNGMSLRLGKRSHDVGVESRYSWGFDMLIVATLTSSCIAAVVVCLLMSSNS